MHSSAVRFGVDVRLRSRCRPAAPRKERRFPSRPLPAGRRATFGADRGRLDRSPPLRFRLPICITIGDGVWALHFLHQRPARGLSEASGSAVLYPMLAENRDDRESIPSPSPYRKIGCRRCLRVRYRSQCGDAKDRAHLAIAKIEQRLITRRGRFYKPKGMLWRTFHRLCDRYDHHDAVLNAGLVRAVQRLGRRFGPL